jgi:hypothetical protein
MAMAMAPCSRWTVICAATEKGKYTQTNKCLTHNHHRAHRSRQSQLHELSINSLVTVNCFDTY